MFRKSWRTRPKPGFPTYKACPQSFDLTPHWKFVLKVFPFARETQFLFKFDLKNTGKKDIGLMSFESLVLRLKVIIMLCCKCNKFVKTCFIKTGSDFDLIMTVT